MKFLVNVAVPYAALGVFSHQGQICIAASRLYVQSGIYDEFVKRAVQFAKTLAIGDPTDAKTQHGPQVLIEIKRIINRSYYSYYLHSCDTRY